MPLTATNYTLEIVDWRTPAAKPGELSEFVLRFTRPYPVGTVLAYEPGEVSFMVSNRWQRLPPGNDDGRKLQVLPLPPGETIEALRFIPSAAALPFVTLLPVRLMNIASEAEATTQLGSVQLLVDGAIDAHKNFVTTKRNSNITPEKPEWIQLTWKQPQAFRGLIFFRGSNDPGLGRGIIQTMSTNGWETVQGRSTLPGGFRNEEFFVTLSALSTRTLRITTTGEVDQVGLGEIAVLRDIGQEPAPLARKK